MEDLLLLTLPLLFVALWCLGCLTLARFGGWWALSRRYRATGRSLGSSFWMQSGAVGSVWYRSCLTLRVDREGLSVAVLPLWRFAHPPLSIPWREFHDIEERRGLFWRGVKMKVGSPPVATVEIPTRVLQFRPSTEASGPTPPAR
jgi:hypothetical protein